MALKQFLSQKLEQRLSPQQIQLMKLLQVPTMELDQRIKQEIEENPALEEGAEIEEEEFGDEQETDDISEDEDFGIADYLSDDADYKTQSSNKGKDGNLDESGYLNREVDAIVDDLAFSANLMTDEDEVESVLLEIQELDPAGIGARDLQECLLIQIKRKQDGDITKYTAKKILEEYFEEFTKKHYTKILKKLEISDED